MEKIQEIQSVKNEMDLNNQKMTNHPPSPADISLYTTKSVNTKLTPSMNISENSYLCRKNAIRNITFKHKHTFIETLDDLPRLELEALAVVVKVFPV